MKRFKNILFYTDGEAGSLLALNRAVDLADQNTGRLTVVDVVEELPREVSRLAGAMPWEDLQSMAMREAREQLELLVSPFQEKGSPVNFEVLCGKPFIEVIRAVLRRQHDLVMMTADGRSELMQALFGSTSLHLMRKCPCPVWVIKPSQTPRFAKILAAVDPDPLDTVRNAVNARIMELATSLAELEDCELHVVHAWQAGVRGFLPGWQARATEAWVRRTHAVHQRRFRQLLGQFELKNPKHRLHLIEGEAGVVIPQLADKEVVDLIVMGTVARTGIEGYFIGNTAETVLQRVACSVLTVKPEGFVSPVKLD